jgi:hypothetical protein
MAGSGTNETGWMDDKFAVFSVIYAVPRHMDALDFTVGGVKFH